MRTEFHHEIRIPLAIGEAFPLFTPKGEELWVPGWKPDYISPASGETCEEMIFQTDHGNESTLWTCLQWQPDQHHVRYLRVTPRSRAAFVDVRCASDGLVRTLVRISYAYVALSESGHAVIESMSRGSFSAMIDEWATLIDEYQRGQREAAAGDRRTSRH
jgi:hypothetical protein